MHRYQFSIALDPDTRQAGVVFGGSFGEALDTLENELDPREGALLELGVGGFPPARFERVWSIEEGALRWLPRPLLAAA